MSLLHGFIPSTQKKHKLKNINEKSIPKLLNEIISRIRNVQDAVVTHLKLPLNRWDLNLFISYLMSQNCHSGDNFLRLYFGNIFPWKAMKPPKLSKLEPQKQSLETDMTKHFCLIHLQRRKVKHNIYSVKNKTCFIEHPGGSA